MARRIAIAVAAGVLVVAAVAVVGEIQRQAFGSYAPYLARVDSYTRSETEPNKITIGTGIGAGDELIGVEVREDARTVTVLVRARDWRPPRGIFKNLSRSLLSLDVSLRSPLGGRVVIDGSRGDSVLEVVR